MKRYYLDLFSGIGGFALGAKWAGLEFDGHYFSEVDKYASEVYQRRFPGAIALGDVRKIDYGKIREECMGGLSKLKAAQYEDMYNLYCGGKSLAQVAETYQVSRQAVYDVFHTRGWALRTKVERPLQMIDGKKFSLGNHGYYSLTTDKGVLAHRYVWEKENGVIPDGYDIHHIDGDKSNNAIFNLQLLKKSDHTRLHQIQEKEEKMEPAPIVVSGGFPDHANLTVSPESEKPPKTSVIYGLNAGECFASYDRESRSLKMSLGSLFPMEAGFSGEFCGTLPKAGMMRNGRLYPLSTLERPIYESGSGLWPTPAAAYYPTPDTRGFTNKGSLEMLADVAGSKDEFIQMAYRASKKKKEAIWPAPTAKGDYGLTSAAAHSPMTTKMWGTPTANDAKNSLTASQAGRGTLTASIVENEGKINGRLNADWCERLMGYPDKWSDIDADEVETSPRYPEAWLDGSWDTIPRITSGQKPRQARLKCLGNAVVPQIPQFLWGLIKEALWV